MVGQAGAGSLRALRGKGTSTTAGYEWATRAAGVSLPCQAATTATGFIVEDGRLRSEPLSLPAPTRSGAQAGTAGSITVPNLDSVLFGLLAVRCSVGSQLPALRDQLATAREGMEHCSKRLQANGDHGGG